LERAGFKPGHRVEVRCDQLGTLTLHFMEQPNPVCDGELTPLNTLGKPSPR
jgi:hypothetical protein